MCCRNIIFSVDTLIPKFFIDFNEMIYSFNKDKRTIINVGNSVREKQNFFISKTMLYEHRPRETKAVLDHETSGQDI